MRNISLWLFTFGLFTLAGSVVAQGGAPPVPLTQNALTNRDVVTLAKAGFNEAFIVDLIHGSQTRFDTSVTGLAEMAKEGLTEGLIRAMLNTGAASTDASTPAATEPAGSAAAPSPAAQEQTRVLRRSETAVALVNQTPYHRSSSLFWGLWKKKVEVGAAQPSNSASQPLGKAYSQARPTPPRPGSTRYVVFP